MSPKRPQGTTPTNDPAVQQVMDHVWRRYPKRPEPHPFVPSRKAVAECLAGGATPQQLIRAVERYRAHGILNETEPQYVKSVPRFFTDDFWRVYDVQTVHGRTREEWARSGQDVLEFDRLLEEAL